MNYDKSDPLWLILGSIGKLCAQTQNKRFKTGKCCKPIHAVTSLTCSIIMLKYFWFFCKWTYFVACKHNYDICWKKLSFIWGTEAFDHTFEARHYMFFHQWIKKKLVFSSPEQSSSELFWSPVVRPFVHVHLLLEKPQVQFQPNL